MLFFVSTIQLISAMLVLIALYLGFKILETKWSYKISKPHNWEIETNSKEISNELKIIEKTYDDKVRFYNFFFQIQRLKKENIQGAFAEVGVYKGKTAQIIHLLDTTRTLHLFDTFEGFNEKDLALEIINNEKYRTSNFADTTLESVKKIFSSKSNVIFHKGYFPETTIELKEERFAFVHLDADLYLPTIAALNYFYPRLSPSGVIVIHDYNHTWAGIVKAVDEFMKTIPESIVEISDWQGSVMIVKNTTSFR